MSEENVDAFKRAIEAANRRDVDALLDEFDPDVEWPDPAILVALGREAMVFRGHERVRELVRDVYEAFAEIHIEITEIRDLGDQLVAICHLRARGTESGAETESPLGYCVRYKNGKAIHIRTFLDPKEALEAAGLSE